MWQVPNVGNKQQEECGVVVCWKRFAIFMEMECEWWRTGAWCGLPVGIKAKVELWMAELQRQLWLGRG